VKVSLWARWKTLARHAARIQSNIILTVLYFLVFLPLALVRRPFAAHLQAGAGSWRERDATPHDLPSARRQF
jgi:hypothetical protein